MIGFLRKLVRLFIALVKGAASETGFHDPQSALILNFPRRLEQVAVAAPEARRCQAAQGFRQSKLKNKLAALDRVEDE